MRFSPKRGFAVPRRHGFPVLLAIVMLLALVTPALTITPASAQGAVPEPIFSAQRGFYNNPFSLSISSLTPGASIRYTLDGSTPSPTVGTVYSAPIPINTTKVVRAIAYTNSTTFSEVATHTYLFLAAIRNQPDDPQPGWGTRFAPDDEVGYYPSDYGMDAEVWDHPNNAGKYEAVMKSLPSLSIVTDLPNLWDPNFGIYYNSVAKAGAPADPYNNPISQGNWERPIAMEWINPDGTTGFTADAGLRAHGQASRKPHRTPKHSFRVYFRAGYGTRDLDFKLFDYDDPVNTFDRLLLRNGGNRNWSYFDRDQRRDADYVNDEFARRAWLDMGNLAPHGTYAHLYLNGMYWGLYNVTERIDDKFVQAYLGGKDTDYQLFEADEDIGDFPSVNDPDINSTKPWYDLLEAAGYPNEITSTLEMSTLQYQNIAALVDVVSLADYMIHAHYIGKTDWPHHNWNAYRNKVTGDKKLRFIPWDNDSGLGDVNQNITTEQFLRDPKIDGLPDEPAAVFRRLTYSPEFRQILADRLYKHLVDPKGVLTPSSCAALYKALTDIVDQPVIAESARWGDYVRDKYPKTNVLLDKTLPAYLQSRDLPTAFTDPTGAVIDDVQLTWTQVRAKKLAEYCPQRSNVVVGQYRNKGWYPTVNGVNPPVFAQYGGAVPANFSLRISNNPANNGNGTIYYTTNGSDPRVAISGAVAAGAQNGGSSAANVAISQVVTIKARIKNGPIWSPMVEHTFYPPQPFEHLVINEIHYNPVAPASPANADPDDFEFLELYNKGNTPLRLDNVYFERGFTFRFPLNTTIGAGQYLVLANKANDFNTRYGFNANGDYRGNMSNNGEAIELRDAVGNVIDIVDYLSAAPWPNRIGGGGGSLSLEDPAKDNSQAVNWFISGNQNGTPGQPNGTPPALDARFGPITLDFGSERVGDLSPTQVVTVTNAGSSPLLVNSATTTGDYARTNNCPASLDPDASCTIGVSFTATALGVRPGSLSVATNAPNAPHVVTLTGIGDNQPRVLTLSTTTLDFGEERVGFSSVPQQIAVTNTGPAPVALRGITTSAHYGHTSNCPALLAPGALCSISVTFAPTVRDSLPGTLTLITNADGGNKTVSLSGTGTTPTKLLSLSATSLSFGVVNAGETSAPKQVTLANTGPNPVSVEGVFISGDYAQTNDCLGTLAPNQSCTLTVTFSPITGGARSGVLSIANDGDDGVQTVALNGIGKTALALSVTGINFGLQETGTSSEPKEVTITNESAAPVTGIVIGISGPELQANSPFKQTSTCPATLAPGESCTVSVVFAPTLEGQQVSDLTITSSATSVPIAISLEGIATSPTTSGGYTVLLPVVRK